jgi:pimeloyl-ACP methyl ester carboxylesterase
MTYGTLAVRNAQLCYKVRGHGVPLLVLQGGGGTADASDGVANVLEGQHTVISYDRRGLLRSPVDDPKEPISIEQHAEDALTLLHALGIETAFVFATSLGALIGLELLAREPERVKLLVAHEPPALELLSEEGRARVRVLRQEVLRLALREGPREALRRALAGMGVDRDDREDDCEPPLSSREQSRETGFLLSREVRAMDSYRLDTETLLRYAERIVPAFGSRSRDFYPAECALRLAAWLGREPIEFPGCHNGYVLRPRAFAAKLGPILAEKSPQSWLRSVAGSDGAELASAPAAS